MKTRIWCKRHRRWHSLHAEHHCKTGHCTKLDAAGRAKRTCTLVPHN